MTGLLGIGPRATPLRVAPSGSSGPRRLQADEAHSGPREVSCCTGGLYLQGRTAEEAAVLLLLVLGPEHRSAALKKFARSDDMITTYHRDTPQWRRYRG
jgi:hypothetical protein